MSEELKGKSKFEIPGISFLGIEDYEDGAPMRDHFFGDNYRSGRDPRFVLWSGGSGIGRAKTLAEARSQLHSFATNELRSKRNKLIGELAVVVRSLERLGGDPFNLARFQVERYTWEKKK